ncbi:aliphatic sulfonate ABC transporter permease SsuC [Alicyclobacillus acidoterrestris]|uniref:Aliphatic sulfonate ABC transporter permease SsuC n=1 Tax=Alicyclobacillus acidoterrestris (strain ATCC 49025 / DSM 3922 / CIP 106132 / NCIMB 13137 / GD3B) TaxID=1356854 RepID=T0BL23_ALIAG|nr:aliphatic sulfonate ABC transporter permease SsuC [Alicyclobacillus acidoterrestris]EPZ44688.1 hypothetical protein N007_10650 [Alicyclobacillus acidoterrestris ATCC 49025]UNO50297.1 aliphatic sulfonate ABC transporter permease SsuC [Alicyclobacillus acidoterrestris]
MQSRVTKNASEQLVPWVLPILLVVIWQVFGSLSLIKSQILPTPLQVIEAGIRLTENGELLTNIGISTERAFVGFAIGGSIGFVLGVINGISHRAERFLDTTIQMIRTVPHLALIPLVIIWFGIGEGAKVFLVALGVFFPIYLNTFHGIRSIDPGLIEMGQVYGFRQVKLYRHVILPGAMPSILVGVRFALGIMWISLIVAETVSATSGIGYMAMNAREFMQMDVVVLSIVLYAILGKLSDTAAKVLERRCIQWRPVVVTRKWSARKPVKVGIR